MATNQPSEEEVVTGMDCQDEYDIVRLCSFHAEDTSLIAQQKGVIKLLVDALTDLVRQLPKDERLADFRLDAAEYATEEAAKLKNQ